MNKPRLIDENKLMEYIVNTPSKVMNEIPYEQTMFTNIQNRVNEILDAIDNQPTAYDIDKVVERLEEELNRPFADCNLKINGICANDREIVASKVTMKYAIEIVKGGVE